MAGREPRPPASEILADNLGVFASLASWQPTVTSGLALLASFATSRRGTLSAGATDDSRLELLQSEV